MIQSLVGVLRAVDSDMVDEKTSLRFKDKTQFKTPESLIIYEQGLLPEERLLDACQREYNCILHTPKVRYIPREILDMFSDYDVIVLDYDGANNKITIGTIPEFKEQIVLNDKYELTRLLVPIYYYVEVYSKQYHEPDFLAILPTVDKWDFIVQEAIQLDASDITLTNNASGACVYYNARKKKVMSRRQLLSADVFDITKILASRARATIATDTAAPRYFAFDVDKQHRGRVVVNKTYYGYLTTIRILSTLMFSKSLEDLGIKDTTCDFIRNVMLSPEKGLRLFIGETMSGKNTSIIAALRELVELGTLKIVSLEQPVEILVDGIEQINAETDDEFALNADSLLRQNPDIVYFTEITERTAESIMRQSNTAKAVFSTVHANSIAGVISRLQDITQFSLDRIILTLHSCVYQELVRDDKTDTVHPYARCVYFSDELKMSLYGKPLSQIIGILQGEEKRWK